MDNQRILIDLYYHQINLAIEIDEPYHSNQSKDDNNRQKKIIQSLGCNVYRIKVKDGNLNKQLDNLFTYINELIQSKNPKMIWRC